MLGSGKMCSALGCQARVVFTPALSSLASSSPLGEVMAHILWSGPLKLGKDTLCVLDVNLGRCTPHRRRFPREESGRFL